MTEYVKLTKKEFDSIIDVIGSSEAAIGQIDNEQLVKETYKGIKAVKNACLRNKLSLPGFANRN